MSDLLFQESNRVFVCAGTTRVSDVQSCVMRMVEQPESLMCNHESHTFKSFPRFLSGSSLCVFSCLASGRSHAPGNVCLSHVCFVIFTAQFALCQLRSIETTMSCS